MIEHIVFVQSFCPWRSVAPMDRNRNANPGHMGHSLKVIWLWNAGSVNSKNSFHEIGSRMFGHPGWSYGNTIPYEADGMHLFPNLETCLNQAVRLNQQSRWCNPEGKLSELKQSLCLTLNLKSHYIIFVCLNEKMSFCKFRSTNQPVNQSLNKNYLQYAKQYDGRAKPDD